MDKAIEVNQMSNEKDFLGIPLSTWGAEEKTVSSRLAQSSFVSPENKYIYLEVPKAACTRIKYIIHGLEKLPPIRASFNRLPETRLYMFIHDRERFQLPSLITLPKDVAESALRDNQYFRFTFVRNPYSRLISAWKNKIYFIEPGLENTYLSINKAFPQHVDGKFINFEGFIRYLSEYEDVSTCNPHYRLQTKLTFVDAIQYDYIGKVEEFSEGMNVFEESIGVHGIENIGGSPANESDKGDWRSHYTGQLARLVYELYEDDFKQFGYEKDSWKGGKIAEEKTARECYLEEQIFDRNRLISQMYQWINSTMPQDNQR